MFRILVVEDDSKLRELILLNLRKWGFETMGVEDFSKVMEAVEEQDPHLVLLDINLPIYDGFYWCRKIRSTSKRPIIFISSRGANMDVVMAVNMGGDDFVQKPFSLDVLAAKMQALLRRTYSYGKEEGETVEHRGAILHLSEGELHYQDKKIMLTRNELRILHLLIKHGGDVLSREKIMRALWEDENFVDDNTLTVNINRLRRKLSDAGLEDWIETRKGQGYVLV
nr:response regulator transcription factor [uncultured Anaeromusa sp.]